MGSHLGGLKNFGGDLHNSLGHFQQIIKVILEFSPRGAQSYGTLVGWFD